MKKSCEGCKYDTYYECLADYRCHDFSGWTPRVIDPDKNMIELKIRVLNSFVREEGNQEEKDCWEVIKNIVRRSYDLY